MPVETPLPATLRRYGLTESDWRKLLVEQGGVCAVCRQEPKPPKKHPDHGGRLCIDHEHVKGWKKMPPEERKRYVRGLVCWVCNHYYLGRGITVAKSRNATAYLEAYESRKTIFSKAPLDRAEAPAPIGAGKVGAHRHERESNAEHGIRAVP